MRDDQRPKYVNTAESELFHKGRQLFGLDHARAPAAKAGRGSGGGGVHGRARAAPGRVPETVAIMGTALTEEQFAELARAAPSVLLALDPDRSGQEAMLRGRPRRRGARRRAAGGRAAGGADPAELVAESGRERRSSSCSAARCRCPSSRSRRVHRGCRPGSTPHGKDKALAAARDRLSRPSPKRAQLGTSWCVLP